MVMRRVTHTNKFAQMLNILVKPFTGDLFLHCMLNPWLVTITQNEADNLALFSCNRKAVILMLLSIVEMSSFICLHGSFRSLFLSVMCLISDFTSESEAVLLHCKQI